MSIPSESGNRAPVGSAFQRGWVAVRPGPGFIQADDGVKVRRCGRYPGKNSRHELLFGEPEEMVFIAHLLEKCAKRNSVELDRRRCVGRQHEKVSGKRLQAGKRSKERPAQRFGFFHPAFEVGSAHASKEQCVSGEYRRVADNIAGALLRVSGRAEGSEEARPLTQGDPLAVAHRCAGE